MSLSGRVPDLAPAVTPETAAMKRGTTRWAHRVLALCVSTCAASFIATVLVGCDDYGEKQALNDQSTSAAQRAGGETEKALQTLSAAAGSSSSSAAVIQAQQALGQVKLAKANAGATEVGRMRTEAGATLAQIGRLARQARASVTLANNYRKLDPKLTIEQVGDFAAKARGDGDITNYPVESATLPTLAVAQQNKSKVDGEVAQAEQAIAAATAERDAALAEAGKVSAAVESQSGEQRAASVKQIADARSKAALASRTITEQTKLLTRGKAEQAEADQIVSQLQNAVETLSAQGTSLTQGWQSLSAKASDQTALAKKLVDGSDGETVRALTKTLNDQLKEIEAKRADVETLYNEAIADFEKAAGNAGKRVTELNTAKQSAPLGAYERQAWDNEISLLAVDRINLDKAAAQKALADLEAGRAKWLAAAAGVTEDVESVSETLNVGAAEPFNGDKLKTDLGKSITDAATAYQTVLETLEGAQLSTPDLAPLKPMSVVLKIVSMANCADLGDLAAAHSVAPDVAKKSKEMRDGVKSSTDAARAENIVLPSLPMSLGGNPAPATAPSETTVAAPAATADDATTAEIRAVSLKISQALEAGDAEAVKQLVIINKGAEAEVQKLIDLVAKLVRFRKVVSEKFPNDPGLTAMLATLTAEGVTAEETYKVDGEKAYAEPITAGELEDFRKVDGAWKGVVSVPVSDAAKAKEAEFVKLTDVFAKIADDVEAGTITEVPQVMERVMAAAPAGGAAPGEPPAAPAPEPAPAP
jgi:hypothetical protein